VVGDRQIAGRSAVNLRPCRIKESISVICGQMGWMGGLCVFVSSCLRCGSVTSVSLWFSSR
jgi:hypothetical protein